MLSDCSCYCSILALLTKGPISSVQDPIQTYLCNMLRKICYKGMHLVITSCLLLKTAGGIVLGSVAVSAVSVDVFLYISVAIKASFLKLGMCNICKNNITKMFLDFFLI